MRVFGGQLAGMPLLSPGPRVRPSMERLRDACARHFGERLIGAKVVDLFAGTGALGLELVSQGAASCDFIENGDSAMHSLKANVATFKSRAKKLGLTPQIRVFFKDAIPFSAALPRFAYDIALCDPPYGSKKLDRILATWLAVPFSRWLVIEHEPMHPFDHQGRLVHRLRIEDSTLSVLSVPTTPEPGPGDDGHGGPPGADPRQT